MEQTDIPTPDYKAPPITEVAIGVEFQHLQRLKLPHVGALWDQFRKEFPIADHAPPIASEASAPIIDSSTGLPLPRAWFINTTQSRLIQFQPDRLYFNWRRRDQDSIYPRYPELIERFSEIYSIFDRSLAELGLGVIQPTAYEITYINHIVQETGSDASAEMSKVFRDFLWSEATDRYLPRPTNIAWQSTFELPEGQGRLNAKVNPAKRSSDFADILLFELSARGSSQANTEFRKWFDMAHDRIVKGFADLTTVDIQQNIWGRTR